MNRGFDEMPFSQSRVCQIAQDDNEFTWFGSPDAQRVMAARARATLRSIAGSHAVDVAKAEPLASFIEEAALAVFSKVESR